MFFGTLCASALSCDVFFLADIHICLQREQTSSTIQEGIQHAGNIKMFSTVFTHEVFTDPNFFLFRFYQGTLLYFTKFHPLWCTLPFLHICWFQCWRDVLQFLWYWAVMHLCIGLLCVFCVAILVLVSFNINIDAIQNPSLSWSCWVPECLLYIVRRL